LIKTSSRGHSSLPAFKLTILSITPKPEITSPKTVCSPSK